MNEIEPDRIRQVLEGDVQAFTRLVEGWMTRITRLFTPNVVGSS